MQTNTKVSHKPKKFSLTLTPELIVLSIIVVAALIVGLTALRGTVTIAPIKNTHAEMFTNKYNSEELKNSALESQALKYAQNTDDQSAPKTFNH